MASNERARFETRPPAGLREHPAHEALIPRAPEEEFAELKRSIAAEGRVRVPLVILPDGVVLCGRDRLRAARELGLAEVPVEVREDLAGDPNGQIRLLLDDNLTRKHFSEALRVKLAAKLLEIEAERAACRVMDGARRGGLAAGRGCPRKPGGNFAQGLSNRSRDVVARRLGISGRQLDMAKKVVAAAEDGTAPVARLYREDVVTASLAHEAMRKLGRAEQERIVAAVRSAAPSQQRTLARRLVKAGLARRKPAGSGPLEEVIASLEKAMLVMRRLRNENVDVYRLGDSLTEDQRTRILLVASEVARLLDLLTRLREHAMRPKRPQPRDREDGAPW